ncbi:MAG: DUF2059 domain-containing protein [Novosphingobium sp.]|nr:DUF2059 domain-containing protein [Novosphingobium sp.]
MKPSTPALFVLPIVASLVAAPAGAVPAKHPDAHPAATHRAAPHPAAETAEATAAPADPERLALSREIVDVAFPTGEREAMFGGVIRAMLDQLRANAANQIADAGLRTVVERHIAGLPERLAPVTDKHIPMLIDAMANAYAREFSLDELKEIRAFAGTPAGKHYLARNTALLADPHVEAANQAYLNEAMQQVRGDQGSLRAEINAYVAKHPEARPKPPAPSSSQQPEGR